MNIGYYCEAPLSLNGIDRDTFMDSFTFADFLHYVHNEQEFKKQEKIISLYFDSNNRVVIEEQFTNGWEKFFETTKTVYEIDRSWRFILGDWFDHVASVAVEI